MLNFIRQLDNCYILDAFLFLASDAYCNTAPIKLLAVVFLGLDFLNLYWFRLMFRVFYYVIRDKIKEAVKNRTRLHQMFEEESMSDLEMDEDKID